ncbi:DNA invertase Pin-like site-specific DNA recombinase [Sphingomonas insulae]|uniref:helix-turn-helix domain-containing protein n=1 Tax=Sphingomonas insulae TaxID=424800 RepID=UPI0020136B3F|nr:helix-turn-helix domain-containing protein [Sphingomonas insulae]NIJ30955.1 DNA invertase Pin-like site-specific DNA recombinase [Sphingomonas insulae]
MIVADRQSFNKLGDLLARHGIKLTAGDRIKVYDLSCITLSTTTLIRTMTKMLSRGIAFEIVSAGIVIEPRADDKLHALLGALDGHYGYLHGLKTHPIETASRGRRRILDPDQLPQIRAKLDAPGATATDVARELGVARSTLFNFLDRYGRDRGAEGGEQSEQRRSDDAGDQGHVPEGKANQRPA